VSHSQGSLRENPKFLQNFRTKNNILIDNFYLIFLFNIYHFDSDFALQNNYYTTSQKLCVFPKRKFPKLMLKKQVSFVNEVPELEDLGTDGYL
jgi:hypothetical protein